MSDSLTSSRIPGFYNLNISDRQTKICNATRLSDASRQWMSKGELSLSVADKMSENVISWHGLPFSVALNFRVNQCDYLIPMAVEEPSVVAAASHAARIVRLSGGFIAQAEPAIMTGQIQFDGVSDPELAAASVRRHQATILSLGNAAIPRIVARGGGCVDLEVRRLLCPESHGLEADTLIVIHVYVNVVDAMGANIVDTVAEAIAPALHELIGGSMGLRILTNLPLRRLVRVNANISEEAVGGAALADGIARASRYASNDPLRAVTHNKGIMNGIDAAAVALGQDWRAIEAGAHAYAALNGTYRPLSNWHRTAEGLRGALELPLPVGVVGGPTQIHPGVRAALELINVKNATELSQVVAAAGLASNLAALRALAGEGIQRGHMRLHRRRFRTTTTCPPEDEEIVVPQSPQPVGGVG